MGDQIRVESVINFARILQSRELRQRVEVEFVVHGLSFGREMNDRLGN